METRFSPGIPGVEINTQSQARRAKRKNANKSNKVVTRNEVQQEIRRSMVKSRVIKYFDTYLAGQNSTTTVGYSNLTLVPQGVTQSTRVADTIWITSIDWRMNATTANSDIFATMRWGIFVWKQNTNSVTPGVSSIYESAATYGTLSPLNFEGREYYTVLIDECENFTGVAAAPTVNSQLVKYHKLALHGHRVDFEQGATTGSGTIYFVNFSDSALVPHPVYTFQCRIWYYDE